MLKATGFCWKCGRVIKEPVFIEIGFDGYLFCSKKHEQQYYRDQDRKVRRGKKAGYGLAGSTH